MRSENRNLKEENAGKIVVANNYSNRSQTMAVWESILTTLPSIGLRLMQPYASQILEGQIPVFFRTRATRVRGPVLVLTMKKVDEEYKDSIDPSTLNRAIGTVKIVDCIKTSKDEIESGRYPFLKVAIERYPPHLLRWGKDGKICAWILKDPVKIPLMPYTCTPSLSVLVKNVRILKEEERRETEEVENTSVWDFGRADEFPAHHLFEFHGWYPPQVARNCILRYSKKGDIVLDCFVGSGTTLVECKRYGRRGIGIDINPKMIEITRQKLSCTPGQYEQVALVGDARELLKCLSETPLFAGQNPEVDCIVTHPPYWKAIEYSKEHGGPIEGDLSLDESLEKFLEDMKKVFRQMFEVLKPGGYCCVAIGDIGEGGFLIPLGFHLTQLGLEVGFKMKDIAIWILSGERSTRISNYRVRFTEGHNCLIIKHNYVLIFQKPMQPVQRDS